MGRTNPTFRDFLEQYEDEWAAYRRGLRRQHKPHFDRLFERARQHADAAGYMNAADPEIAMLLSVLLAQEGEIHRLRRRIEAVESEGDSDGATRDELDAAPDDAA